MSKPYNRKDHLYNQAKSDGYRSRAAYKLKELNSSFRLFSRGATVIDLGCWPGGWMQVASDIVGPGGKVVGVDLVAIEPLNLANVVFIKGDARSEETHTSILGHIPSRASAVISDMSPKLTGIREADMAGSVACAEICLEVATKFLNKGGSFVVKLFKSQEAEAFAKSIRANFEKIRRCELDATRSSSNEFYLVGTGWRDIT